MKSGPPICALRASERPIDDSDFIGWPTPMAGTPAQNGYNEAGNNDSSRRTVAVPRGWDTPKAHDGRHAAREQSEHNPKDGQCACLAWDAKSVRLKGWATPRARDYKGNGVSIARAAKGVADSLDLQCKLVCRSGMEPPSPSSARMDGAAYRLNPRHSLWLQGFPNKWENFAVQETPSSPS
jgi:hypothetical protein